MDISIIRDNEIEDELKVYICCSPCATKKYGWSTSQFDDLLKKLKQGVQIEVPGSIATSEQFVEFVKSNF